MVRIASFFSGAGGLDLGFEKAGFETCFATDIEQICCETLETNKGVFFSNNLQIECADIRELDYSILPADIDFVVGGPPCQSFSASGRRAGGAAGRLDSRGTLFEAYCGIIDHLKPKGFLFENVRGILGTNKGKDWKEIVESFKSIGYNVSFRILDACDYGIPQHRERMFLVGHSGNRDFLFPRPTHGPDSKEAKPHLSAGDVLAGAPHDEDLAPLFLKDGKYSHLLPEVPPGQNYLFFTAKRGYPNPVFAYRSRFSDFLYKADPSSSTKTIIASPGKYTGPLHWENRYFSVAEYKRLQGIDDEYILCGNRSEKIKQVGNSVSPAVAYKLALAVRDQFFDVKEVHIEAEPSSTGQVELMAENFKLSFDKRKGQKAQRTRSLHREAQCADIKAFSFKSYRDRVTPTTSCDEKNVACKVSGKRIALDIYSSNSSELSAKMQLVLNAKGKPFNGDASQKRVGNYFVTVSLFGSAKHSIQAMWNAVDDLIIRSSNYHSLIELYGHFTEPHPIFAVLDFEIFSKKPIFMFAKYIADFSNCSKFINKDHLYEMFGDLFSKGEFAELATELRSYRFDVRSYETNVAIDPTKYMVAYPFTLPRRKQMNFAVKNKMKVA